MTDFIVSITVSVVALISLVIESRRANRYRERWLRAIDSLQYEVDWRVRWQNRKEYEMYARIMRRDGTADTVLLRPSSMATSMGGIAKAQGPTWVGYSTQEAVAEVEVGVYVPLQETVST